LKKGRSQIDKTKGGIEKGRSLTHTSEEKSGRNK